MSDANIALVRGLYAARDRGDVEALLAGMTRDIEWHSGGTADDHALFGSREGHAAVGDFFRQVADMHDFSEFAPREFYSDKDKVFVLGNYAMTVKRTGRKFASDFVHIFTIRDGRVSRFREMTDTAALVAANRD